MNRNDIPILTYIVGIFIFMVLLVSGVIAKAECEGLRGGEWIEKTWPSGMHAGGYCEAQIIEKRGG